MINISTLQPRIQQNYKTRHECARIIKKAHTWYLAHMKIGRRTGRSPCFHSEKAILHMATLDVTDPHSFRLTKKMARLTSMLFGGVHNRYQTNNEIQKLCQIAFDHLRPLYKGPYRRLQQEFKIAPEEKHLDIFYRFYQSHRDRFAAIVPQLYKAALACWEPLIPPTMAKYFEMLPLFFQQLESNVPLEEMKRHFGPHLDAMEQQMLEEFRAKTGQIVSSREEMSRLQTRTRLEEAMSTYKHLKAPELLQQLVRSYLGACFFESVKEDISKDLDNTNVLQAFNNLILDYISPIPSTEWRFKPDLNFGYAVSSIEKMIEIAPTKEKSYFYQRLRCSYLFLYALEQIYEDFAENEKALLELRHHLPAILFANPQELMKTAPNPIKHPIAYGLMEAILRKAFKEAPEKFTEAILDKLLYYKINLMEFDPSTQAVPYNPTLEERELLELVFKNFDAATQECFLWAEKLKTPDQQKELPIFGIGFSGPLFDIDSSKRKNTLFVSFTHKFTKDHSIAGLAFLIGASLMFESAEHLKKIIDFMEKNGDLDNIPLPLNFGLNTPFFPEDFNKNAIVVLDSPSPEDQKVQNYIGIMIFDQICKTPALVHPDIVATYKQRIQALLSIDISHLQLSADSLDKKIARFQSKKNLRNELPKLQAKKAEVDRKLAMWRAALDKELHQLSPEVLLLIKDKFLNNENRVCLEPMINHLAGTPYTFSFERANTKNTKITFNNHTFSYGQNTLIQPCSERCQLMSAAHALWGELNHFPTAQQMDSRKRKATGTGLESIYG